MDLYNSLINEVTGMLPQGGKTWVYDSTNCWKDNGQAELVLSKDAAFELGASGKGSANLVLYTSSKELINEDKVTLYGPDISEIKDNCDFARIVIIKVGMLDGDNDAIYRTLKDIEFAKYHVYPQGYMVRMSPESYREQVRVSKEVISRGISFSKLGNSYIREYKKDSNVLSVQVIFITDPQFDYSTLTALAKKANGITGTLSTILEGLPTDCSACQLKDICEEVDGMKELHFGIGSKGSEHH